MVIVTGKMSELLGAELLQRLGVQNELKMELFQILSLKIKDGAARIAFTSF